MKQNINEELNYMKYLLGYKKGVVISEQEMIYWGKRGLSPDYMYELAEEGWEEYIN